MRSRERVTTQVPLSAAAASPVQAATSPGDRLEVQVVPSVTWINRERWAELAPVDDPLWTWSFFRAMEVDGLGPSAHDYVLARRDGELVAVLPTASFTDLMLDDTMGDGGQRALAPLRRLCPRLLRVRALFCGNLLGEGRVLAAPGCAAAAAPTLLDGVRMVARRRGLRWLVFKDFPASQLEPLRPALAAGGFTEMAALPDAQLRLAAPSFDEHIRDLPPAARRNARRNIRKLECREDLRVEVIAGKFEHLVERMLPLYHNVLERAESKLDRWTPEFFHAISGDPSIVRRLVLCWQGERLVAFLLCVFTGRGGAALRVGLDYAVAPAARLYHNVHYRGITEALRLGCNDLNFSQTAYEAKREMGCHLIPLAHSITHVNPLLRPAIRHLLPALLNQSGQPTASAQRRP